MSGKGKAEKAPKVEKVPKVPSAGKLSALERKEAKKKSKDDLSVFNALSLAEGLDEFGDALGRFFN